MNKEKMTELFSKNKNMKPLYIILIIGVVLLFLSNALFGGEDKKESENMQTSVFMPTKELATELEKILSRIKGVGNVKVMITYESTGEKQLAADVTSEQSSSSAADKSESGRTQLQSKQTSKLFAPDDAAVVTKESFPKVMGVIVVCDGGADVQVKAAVTNAVRAVLDVADHKIGVFAGK